MEAPIQEHKIVLLKSGQLIRVIYGIALILLLGSPCISLLAFDLGFAELFGESHERSL